MNDLISVIITVQNGSRYIREAIDGIRKQGMNTEIIVTDNCSTDNTVEIVENLGCKVIKHKVDKGPVGGKNSALKIAKGKYILFHDHDDVMRDVALKKLYEELTSDNTLSAVEAKVQDFLSPELTEEEKATSKLRQQPYWGLFTGAILMKKGVFDVIGLFDESIQAGEIIEWQDKMEADGLKIKKLDFVSTDRRIHTTNFGKKNRKQEFKDYSAILRAKLMNKK